MYGKRARIGCIVPSTNTVVESEYNRMKPEGVSIHAARIKALEVTTEALKVLAESAHLAADQLATAQVNIIVFACTSASFLAGAEWERRLVDRMQAASSVKSITTSGAVVEALAAMGCKRISVATPYTDSINELEKSFLTQKGFEVLNVRGLQKVTNTEIGRLEPDDAYRIAKEAFDPASDGLFISCTDFRTIEIIEKLEDETAVPVVTSNQASFWSALRASGIRDKINGYGKLLLT